MKSEKLKYLIKNGQNSIIELAEESISNDSIAKGIIAFLNFKGGTILFGVNDDKEIVGVKDDKFEERIMNIFYQKVFPSIIPDYQEHIIDNKKVVIVSIDKGEDKPYYTKLNGENCYFIRYGSTSREASREELIRLFQPLGNIHFELTPVLNASLKDIDMVNLIDYFEKYRGINLEDFSKKERKNILINNEIILNHGDEIVPTVAGMLLFGKKPKRFLPNVGIRAMIIDGNKLSDSIIDHKFFERDIFYNIEGVLDYLKISMKMGFEIKERLQREDIIDYPIKVLRELIVNAVAHRDYTITGSNIAVIIYTNRIEIKSPGLIPNTLTIDKIRQGIMYHRNPLLLQFLYDSAYVERLGRGVRICIEKMKEFNGTDIEITTDRAETVFRVFK